MRINTRPIIVAVALGLLAAAGARTVEAQQYNGASSDTALRAKPGTQTGQAARDTSLTADTTGSMETGRVVPADTSTYAPPRADSGMYAPPDSASYAPPSSDSGTYAPPTTSTTNPPPPAGATTNPPPAGTAPVQPPNSSSQPPEH